MKRIEVDVVTGEVREVAMTPEEIAALPPPQPPAVPMAVTRAQGKVALMQTGKWQAALDYVVSIADPAKKAMAEIAMHDTLEWRRDSAFLQECATALGLTGADLDALFIEASKVQL